MASVFIDLPITGGVTTINGLSGAVTLAAGSNITLTPSGNTITIASTGGGGGVTLAAFGSTPNANGLSISGSSLNMQPADLTNPGGVSIVAQTFTAPKTFEDASTTARITLTSLLNTSNNQTQAFINGLDQNSAQNLCVGANFWIYGTTGAAGAPILNLYDTAGPYLCTVQVDASGGFVFTPQGGLSTFSGQITCASIYSSSPAWHIDTAGAGYMSSGALTWDNSGNFSSSSVATSQLNCNGGGFFNGNVGFNGNNSPSYAIDVGSGGNIRMPIAGGATSGTIIFSANGAVGSGRAYDISSDQFNNGDLAIRRSTSNSSAPSITTIEILNTGMVGINNSSPGAMLWVQSADPSYVVMVNRGETGQTADLHQWIDGNGTTVAKVDASGYISSANGFSGTVTPVTSITVLNGIVTAVS